MTRSSHPTALATGLAIVALGVLLVLDAGGTVDLRFAFTAPAVVASVGIVLLASGLEARAHSSGRGLPPAAAPEVPREDPAHAPVDEPQAARLDEPQAAPAAQPQSARPDEPSASS